MAEQWAKNHQDIPENVCAWGVGREFDLKDNKHCLKVIVITTV